MRALVGVGDAAPRWYRSLNEARHDARPLVEDAAVGDVLARAWREGHVPSGAGGAGPRVAPDYELRLGRRGALTWCRTAEAARRPAARA